MARLRRVWLGLLLLTLAAPCASAASPKRVLILDPFGRDVAPFNIAVSSLRTTLARELGEPVDIYELPLELARFAEPEGEIPLVAFLEGRLKEHPVDLVVPIGTGGMQFAARHRERLFQHTPILVVAAEPRMVSPDFLKADATLVTQKASLPGMVEDILQLQPETTNIVVVFGASTLERFWVDVCRREFQVFTNRVGFTWLNHLSLDQMLQQCAALPPRSFILHGLFVVDAVGVSCERNEALRRLHQVANAPVFAYYASEFGLGSIGGRLYQDSEVGAQGARTAIRILRGEKPANIPPQVFEAAAPVFDWRELHRWGISEARLPVGSTIQFRQVGFWERYRWSISGAVLLCLLQAALIIGLLVNRSKRRHAEAEATLIADISSKFVNLPPDEVNREITDAQRRMCKLLGLEVSSLWQSSAEAPEVLALTHLYRFLDGPPTPEPMSANEHFPWCHRELLAGRIVMLSSLEQLPAAAARDREAFVHFGIKSGLIVPLSVGGGPPVGALSFGTVRTERSWPAGLVKRLQQVAEIFTNALARKRAEQALRESEARMTLAADAAQFGVWGWNTVRNQVWGSERWLSLFGFLSGKDVSFEDVLQRIHPDDRGTVEREVARAVANRNDYAGEFRVVLPDGTRRWIASRGRGYLDANGITARMLGAAIDVTERKRAEEALRLSEARLSAGVEIAGLGFVEVDEGTGAVFADDRLRKLIGVPPHWEQGMQIVAFWKDHLHPDDVLRVLHERQEALDGKREELSVEYRYLHPSRGEIWIQHIGRPTTRDATGFAVKSFSVFRDITERRQAENQIRQLSLAVEQSPVSVLITDLQGKMTYVNRKFSELSGYTFNECIGQNPRILKSGECPASIYKELWAVITAGGTWRGEFHNRKKNGELYWEWAVISPLLDDSGKVTHFVGVKEDITERKRTEEALRASEETNRVTFEQAAVGIAHVGIDGRWLRVNEKLCAILGYRPEELMKLTFQDITHPEDLEKDLSLVRQVLSGEIATYSMEKRYTRKNHSVVWTILTVSLVRTVAGEPAHFISVVEDITERKRVEEALRDLSRRLIRAHEEERARLARDLHDDVTQRLARLAIDAGRVEHSSDENSLTETMRSVRDGLVSLSEDIHSLSYRLHPSVLEDLGLAEALKAECERFSRQESAYTEVDVGNVPNWIPPESALCLFRVAQEALRNVARHARARRVKVSVRALDDGLQLAVVDDGIGFEIALQRDRPSLGLASMRERVHLLNGELDIESAPGQGTTILVWLPLKGEAQ